MLHRQHHPHESTEILYTKSSLSHARTQVPTRPGTIVRASKRSQFITNYGWKFLNYWTRRNEIYYSII